MIMTVLGVIPTCSKRDRSETALNHGLHVKVIRGMVVTEMRGFRGATRRASVQEVLET